MTIDNEDIDRMNRRAALQARRDQTPDQVATDRGVFCLLHGVYACPEPSCYACGNHLTDGFGKCADLHCGATNTPDILSLVASLGEDAPKELLAYEIGRMLSRAGRQSVGSESEHASGPASPKVKL